MNTNYKEIEWIVSTTVDKTLTELGLKKDLLSKSEMYRRYGRRNIENALRERKLTPVQVNRRWLYSDTEFKANYIK